MEYDKIKKTKVWEELSKNPKFVEEFEKTIKRYVYYVNINDLKFDVSDKKINVSCKSDVINRDLDCQFKLFNKTEFSLDEDNNLIINEMKGHLESNYGYDFQNTKGGRLNTGYSCWVYDDDGIELSYQSYGDQYILDKDTFDTYKDDFSSVVEGAYNPNLIEVANLKGVYCHPNIVGNNGNFLRQIRDKDNLGLIEVSKCSFDKTKKVTSTKEEFYFNTFFGSKSSYTPDLMHIMSGYPFAIIDNNHAMRVKDDYIRLGLTDKNYREVARERFLKELMEQRENHRNNEDFLIKYNMMIEKIEKELGKSSKRV